MGARFCCAEDDDHTGTPIQDVDKQEAIAVTEVAHVPVSRANTAEVPVSRGNTDLADIAEDVQTLSRPPVLPSTVTAGVTGTKAHPNEAVHSWSPFAVIRPKGALVEAITPITVARGSKKERLGLELRHVKTRLVVMEVRAGEAVHSHNQQQTDPDQVIQIGDVIVQVNSVEGDDAGMIEECKRSDPITFYVRRC
mmetsp:Transcript_74770/g.139592  ORF Transcript_74770/g.139592 Transcript_74770/m.139592 type:complete len:195 (-) Transcript_74770:42-626(-)